MNNDDIIRLLEDIDRETLDRLFDIKAGEARCSRDEYESDANIFIDSVLRQEYPGLSDRQYKALVAIRDTPRNLTIEEEFTRLNAIAEGKLETDKNLIFGNVKRSIEDLLDYAIGAGEVDVSDIDFFKLEGEMVEHEDLKDPKDVYKRGDEVYCFNGSDYNYLKYRVNYFEARKDKLIAICYLADDECEVEESF